MPGSSSAGSRGAASTDRHCAGRESLNRLVADVDGATVDLADSTWRDSHISGGRLGAVSLIGATWTGVPVRGCHLGFLNLAGAHLEDVLFEGCEIGSLDARTAELDAVTFVGCTLDEPNVSGASLRKVDLSGARLRSLIGVESLKGAIVSHEQLVHLAPLLAEQLGLEVRDDRRPTTQATSTVLRGGGDRRGLTSDRVAQGAVQGQVEGEPGQTGKLRVVEHEDLGDQDPDEDAADEPAEGVEA